MAHESTIALPDDLALCVLLLNVALQVFPRVAFLATALSLYLLQVPGLPDPDPPLVFQNLCKRHALRRMPSRSWIWRRVEGEPNLWQRRRTLMRSSLSVPEVRVRRRRSVKPPQRMLLLLESRRQLLLCGCGREIQVQCPPRDSMRATLRLQGSRNPRMIARYTREMLNCTTKYGGTGAWLTNQIP